MQILIAPQEFKGSLTAREAADAIARGLHRSFPDAMIETLPLADGGPGTVDVLVEATGGRYSESDARDPLGRVIQARWGRLGGSRQNTAVIEMAAASGLLLLRPDERDPRLTSTSGTGDLIVAALEGGCSQIIVGVGGSATNDGGAGMATRLGVRFLDQNGVSLPPGGASLMRLARVDVSELDRRIGTTSFVVATDVTNPLCGTTGASILYGPQKGASAAVAAELDQALAHYSAVLARDLGVEIAEVPGAGAAGGLAAGLIVFCGAEVRPGFEVVAGAVGLEERIKNADLVITGEGRIDSQTAFGKTTAGVARACRSQGVPVIAVGGHIEESSSTELFEATFDLAYLAGSPEAAIRDARGLLEDVAVAGITDWVRMHVLGQRPLF
jgi:glycerate kinase